MNQITTQYVTENGACYLCDLLGVCQLRRQ